MFHKVGGMIQTAYHKQKRTMMTYGEMDSIFNHAQHLRRLGNDMQAKLYIIGSQKSIVEEFAKSVAKAINEKAETDREKAQE